MKSQNTFFFIVMCLTVTVLMGCSSGGLKSFNQGGTGDVEYIDPFDYGDEFTQPDFGRKTISESHQNESGMIDKDSETIKNTGNLEDFERQNDSEKLSEEFSSNNYGYSVQIGLFEDQESAEKLAAYARLRVNFEVYVEFDTPFYRVRVGDLKTKADAEKHVKILENKGFKDSRWVITKIKTR